MIRKTYPGVALLLTAANANADWALNMPRGVTEMSAEIYDLHMQVLYWCVAIGIVVFGAMIYSLINHRKSKGVEAADFSHSTKAEIIWTVIPCLILLIMAIPTTRTMIRLEDSRKPDLTIVATGYQWKWHYEYKGENVDFFSTLSRSSLEARRLQSGIDPFSVDNFLLDVDNRLVVPVGAKVRLLLTANDVIHSWWMPDFAVKKDAIPGFMNETWFRPEETGVFRGQCAELCGKDHGYMPIVVEVVYPDEFDAWLAERRPEAPAVAAN